MDWARGIKVVDFQGKSQILWRKKGKEGTSTTKLYLRLFLRCLEMQQTLTNAR
jgi:hypothetical protein